MTVPLPDVLRTLRHTARRPLPIVLTAATLALGVGANAAMADVAYRLMFRAPARVADPGSLWVLRTVTNYVDYRHVAAHARAIAPAAFTRSTVAIGRGSGAAAARVECVSAGYFEVLGLPAFERLLDSGADGTPRVLLSEAFTKQHPALASARGDAVTLAGSALAFAGTVPHDFSGIEPLRADAWIRLESAPQACSFNGQNLLASANANWLTTVGRIQPGFTPAAAENEIAAMFPPAASDGPAPSARLITLRDHTRGRLRQDRLAALSLSGGAFVLFALACFNVAGLISIRAIDRAREFAIRAQLGATRRRIVADLAAENALLFVLCVAAAFAASAAVRLVVRRYIPALDDLAALDPASLRLIVPAAFVAVLGSSFIPSWRAARNTGEGIVRDGGTVARRGARLRGLTIAGQTAFALALVVGATLFARSVMNAKSGLGFDLDRTIVVTVPAKGLFLMDHEMRAMYDALLARAQTIPHVEAAALSSGALLESGGPRKMFGLGSSASAQPAGFQALDAVSPSYFRVTGTRIVDGRAFNDADTAAAAPAAIVDQSLARAVWPDGAVGQCAYLWPRRECIQIVGVSEDRRQASVRLGLREFFLPIAQAQRMRVDIQTQMLILRTSGDPRDALAPIAAALGTAAPDLPYLSIRPLEDLADVQARSWRMGASMFSMFGALAVLLAGVGVYGVSMLAARQRTREIGVRMALGASRRDVLRLILRQLALMLAAGWVIGAAGSFIAGRLARNMLYQASVSDLPTFAIASAVLACAAIAGSIVPSLRAIRVDPALALRNE